MRKNIIEQIDYKRLKINIYADDNPENPREWDNVGTIVCWHNRYNLGDVDGRKEYGDPKDFLAKLAGVDYEDEGSELSKLGGKELINALLKEVEKTHLIMPLFLYDHSGISMSVSNDGYPFNCRWDSGQVGWIYVSHERIREEWNDGENTLPKPTEEQLTKARTYLEGEIATYTEYIEGNVYGYMIEDDGEEFGGCWGFYGYDNEKFRLLDHARDEVDCYLAKKKKKVNAEKEYKENLKQFGFPFRSGCAYIIKDKYGSLVGVEVDENEAKFFVEEFGCTIEECQKFGNNK